MSKKLDKLSIQYSTTINALQKMFKAYRPHKIEELKVYKKRKPTLENLTKLQAYAQEELERYAREAKPEDILSSKRTRKPYTRKGRKGTKGIDTTARDAARAYREQKRLEALRKKEEYRAWRKHQLFLQKQYTKERRRILEQKKRMEQRGYEFTKFPNLVRPKVYTEEAIEALETIFATPNLYVFTEHRSMPESKFAGEKILDFTPELDKTGEEIVPGLYYLEYERSMRAKKAYFMRKFREKNPEYWDYASPKSSEQFRRMTERKQEAPLPPNEGYLIIQEVKRMIELCDPRNDLQRYYKRRTREVLTQYINDVGEKEIAMRVANHAEIVGLTWTILYDSDPAKKKNAFTQFLDILSEENAQEIFNKLAESGVDFEEL